MIYFRRLGSQFNPDVLLLALCQNDITGTKQDFLWRRSAGPPVTADRSRFARVKLALANASVLYRLVTDVMRSNRTLSHWGERLGVRHAPGGYDELDISIKPFLKAYPPELAHEWDAAMAQLIEFNELLEARGIRFVVAVIPAVQSVDRGALERTLASTTYYVEDFDLDRPLSALARVAHERAFDVVDATPAFRAAASGGAALYLAGDMHFSKAGHQLFAKVIADYLDGDASAK
jgi:hypothetical protein